MTAPEASRRETVLTTFSDTMAKFMYYDRKEDLDLPPGAIEAAIQAGEVTVDELIQIVRDSLVIHAQGH